MMKRREFITLLGGAAAWPLAARAQQGDRMRRIGVLMPYDENDPLAKTFVSAFIQALADLGWTGGRNVRLDLRWGGTDINRIRALAQELVGLQPDINPDNRDRCDRSLATGDADDPDRLCDSERRPPSPAASSRGSTARVGTSPASPSTKSRWQASGLSCSRRSRPA